MVLSYDSENDLISINPEKLRWVFELAKDSLKQDAVFFDESPMFEVVQHNLKDVQEGIDFIDNL